MKSLKSAMYNVQILKDAMAFYQEDKEKRSTDLSSDSDNQLAYSTSYACHKVGYLCTCTKLIGSDVFIFLLHRVTAFTHSTQMVSLGVLLTWLERW